mmetsp:Transcript_25128/g.46601  ORF Transcript_25128/g.46601 Transcript_25128/m.46601 type:complete len:229 (-) Transcript_25128:254-940(-)
MRLKRVHRRRLKEREPTVPDGQRHHDHDLHNAEELAGHHALVPHVLRDQRQRRQKEAPEVRPDERPLDLSVVDGTGLPYHDALGRDEGAEQPEDGPGHTEFARRFGREEEVCGEGRPDVSDGSEDDREEGVQGEEGVQPLLRLQVVVDVEGQGAVSSSRRRIGIHRFRRSAFVLRRVLRTVATVRRRRRIAVGTARVFGLDGGGSVRIAHAFSLSCWVKVEQLVVEIV